MTTLTNGFKRLTPLDELFTTQEERDIAQRETVIDIPLSEISDFPNHPFKVTVDEKMLEMADSIKRYGVLVPAIFEDVLITGHTAYTLEEVNVEEKYIVPDAQTTVIERQKVTEKSFYNELKRGSVKVTKSSEDGFVEGVTFRLKGTSLSGATINLTAKTDHTGIAVFNDVLIGAGYVLTEENVAMRYVLPEAQNVDVKWNEVTGATVKNILKKWRADVFKVDADIYFGDGSTAMPQVLRCSTVITQDGKG